MSCAHLKGFFFTASKKNLEFLVFWFKKEPFFRTFVKVMINGNRAPCCPIWSVIILVIKQIALPLCGCLISLITHLITDWTGLHPVLLLLQIGWHEDLLPINHKYYEICDIWAFFKLETQKNPGFFCWQWKKKAISVCDSTYCPIINYLGRTRTVLLVQKSGQLIANQNWEFCHNYD